MVPLVREALVMITNGQQHRPDTLYPSEQNPGLLRELRGGDVAGTLCLGALKSRGMVPLDCALL